MNNSKYDKWIDYNDLWVRGACEKGRVLFDKLFGRHGRLHAGDSGLAGLLLHEDARQHIGWLVDQGLLRVDMEWWDLSGMDLRYLQLSDAYVRACNFAGASLLDSSIAGRGLFVCCGFAGADLRFSRLSYSQFTRCNFEGADLGGTKLRNCNIASSSLRNARGLNTAYFHDCTMLEEQRRTLVDAGANVYNPVIVTGE